MKTLQSFFTALITYMLGLSVHANYITMDTANLVETKQVKFHFNTQLSNLGQSTDHNKLEINTHIDKRLTFNSGIRGTIGISPTDFRMGGFFKWAPIPDLSAQPAISLLTGIIYASLEGGNDLSFRVHPIISKNFEVKNIGRITPYGSLPMGIRSLSHKNIDFPIHLTLGTEIHKPEWKQINFMAEVSINLQNSSNYFGFGINFNLNSETSLISWFKNSMYSHRK